MRKPCDTQFPQEVVSSSVRRPVVPGWHTSLCARSQRKDTTLKRKYNRCSTYQTSNITPPNNPLTSPPGNAGLGAETVRRLAAHSPSAIYLCARNPSSAEPLILDIKSSYPNAKFNIIPIKLDLSSLESTKLAAETILSHTSRIDILYNNAGIALVAPALTKDGYETQFGINYFGHALFTQLLLPLMLQTAATAPKNSVRIVNVSSEAHIRSVPNGLALEETKTHMSAHHSTKRYGQSKVAQILFAQKMAQLYPSVTSVSLHPGFVATEINTGKGGGSFWLGLLIRNIVGWVGLSVEDGTKNQLWAGVAPEVESGKYYDPIGVVKAGSSVARDEKKREELWQWTEKELKAHGGPGWPEIK